MLTDKERQLGLQAISPGANAVAKRNDTLKPTTFLQGLAFYVLLLAALFAVPILILIAGRYRVTRHLTGTWSGELRSEKPSDSPPTVDSFWSDSTKRAETARWQAQKQAYLTDERTVRIEVHSNPWHFAGVALTGNVILCDAQGHREDQAFSTTNLGDDFFYVKLPATNTNAPTRNVSASLRDGGLHLDLDGEHATVQGNLSHSAASPQAPCGAS